MYGIWKEKYEIGYCGLCECWYIKCSDCGYASCTGGGCEKCTEDFKQFNEEEPKMEISAKILVSKGLVQKLQK